MTDICRIAKVFLASPGDLPDERRLIKATEEEINAGIAVYLGCRIEIKGWEDTLPGSGRPQAIINEELKTCELFIGMMSRKWGTPPSRGGIYTSGFEEEFELSSKRHEETGKPEIAMFFKKIEPKFLVDQGDDLKKVIAFKERIASKKSILYQEFDDPHELQRRVRLKIQKYLMDLKIAEEKGYEEEQAKTKKSNANIDKTKDKEAVKSPFSSEGHEFLKGFLEKTKADGSAETITPLEVARFRLLSSVLSQSGNDEPFLGVHDANILYANKHNDFGPREISRLIDCGLKNIRQENVPLWHWCGLYEEKTGQGILAFKSIFYSGEDVGNGALEAMRLIGAPLPVDGQVIDRNIFIKKWLSENSPDSIKVAALRYLKHHGKTEDLPLIQFELDRADYETSRIALEAIVSIQLHYNETEALKAAFENRFTFFDETLLEKLLSVLVQQDDETLKRGLSHSNKRIRLESFKRLKDKKNLNAEQIQSLKNDSFARIRKEAVNYLILTGQSLSDKDVKDILVKPQKTGGLLSLGAAALTLYDEEGEGKECYNEYLFSMFQNMPEEKLLEITKKGSIFDDIPYFALCSRYFKSHSEELRKDVDDQFKSKFEAFIEHMKIIGDTDENLKSLKDLEDFLRQKLTRKALDVLCTKCEVKDLNRIRNSMRTEYVKSSDAEIEYFRKLGKWEDITFILKAEKDPASKRISPTNSIDDGWPCSVAKALYAVGKGRIDELLNIEMPVRILVELIKMCSSTEFLKGTSKNFLVLFECQKVSVRKSEMALETESLQQSYGEHRHLLYWLPPPQATCLFGGAERSRNRWKLYVRFFSPILRRARTSPMVRINLPPIAVT